MGHAHHHLARAVGRAELDRLVEHGHQRVEALDRELLLAQEGLVQIALQGLDLRQAPQQPPPGLLVERLAVGTRLDRLAQPYALLVVGDVLDLVGDRARVGVAQSRQRVRERFARHRHAQDRRGDAPHQVVGELDRGRLEGRVAHRRRAERVELRGQVTVHAMGLDQRGGRLHRLEQRRVGHGAGRRDGSGGHRLGGGDRGGLGGSGAPVDAQALEHSLVEAVGALQELVHPAQEGARFRALDHPVVVGAGHGHDLLHAQLTQLVRGQCGEAGRVADRPRGHDRALAGHEPRHAGHRADAARVGEGDVRALIGVGSERVVARSNHQLVVAGDEGGEVHLARVGEHRDHERVAAVLALHVHRQAEAGRARRDAQRLAVLFRVGVAHHRHVASGLDHGPGDQMGERELAAARLHVSAPRVQHVHGHGAEAGGRRYRAALVHEAHERGRGAADRGGVGFGRGGGRGGASVALHGRQHVLLGHPTAWARATDDAQVEPVRIRHARGDGSGVFAVARRRRRLLDRPGRRLGLRLHRAVSGGRRRARRPRRSGTGSSPRKPSRRAGRGSPSPSRPRVRAPRRPPCRWRSPRGGRRRPPCRPARPSSRARSPRPPNRPSRGRRRPRARRCRPRPRRGQAGSRPPRPGARRSSRSLRGRRPPERASPARPGSSPDVPAAGAGTSASTLSVEISTSGSSASTRSPTCLRHSRTVPSVTDSPIWGMVICTVVTGVAIRVQLYPCGGPVSLHK